MIDLTKDELNKLYEGAKNDRFIVVASEVRQMVGMIRRANDRIEQLEAALRRAFDFLQDKSFTPDSLTRECTKVVEQIEAALAPEQDK